MLHYATNILHDFFTSTRTLWWISPGNLITPRGQSYDWPTTTLRWRHNECDSVSNHQPHDCLLSRLSGRRSKLTSKLRVTGLCVGNLRTNGQWRGKGFHLMTPSWVKQPWRIWLKWSYQSTKNYIVSAAQTWWYQTACIIYGMYCNYSGDATGQYIPRIYTQFIL